VERIVKAGGGTLDLDAWKAEAQKIEDPALRSSVEASLKTEYHRRQAAVDDAASKARAEYRRRLTELRARVRSGAATYEELDAAREDKGGWLSPDDFAAEQKALDETFAKIARVAEAERGGAPLDPSSPEDRAALDVFYAGRVAREEKEGTPPEKILFDSLEFVERHGMLPEEFRKSLARLLLSDDVGQFKHAVEVVKQLDNGSVDDLLEALPERELRKAILIGGLTDRGYSFDRANSLAEQMLESTSDFVVNVSNVSSRPSSSPALNQFAQAIYQGVIGARENPFSINEGMQLAADSTPPPLKRLHSDATIETNKSGLDYWRRKPTPEIIDSLKPGQHYPLIVTPNGTVVQGNTRIKILEERGVDVNKLPRVPHVPSRLPFGGGGQR
jgi:hypothetical protein